MNYSIVLDMVVVRMNGSILAVLNIYNNKVECRVHSELWDRYLEYYHYYHHYVVFYAMQRLAQLGIQGFKDNIENLNFAILNRKAIKEYLQNVDYTFTKKISSTTITYYQN